MNNHRDKEKHERPNHITTVPQWRCACHIVTQTQRTNCGRGELTRGELTRFCTSRGKVAPTRGGGGERQRRHHSYQRPTQIVKRALSPWCRDAFRHVRRRPHVKMCVAREDGGHSLLTVLSFVGGHYCGSSFRLIRNFSLDSSRRGERTTERQYLRSPTPDESLCVKIPDSYEDERLTSIPSPSRKCLSFDGLDVRGQP